MPKEKDYTSQDVKVLTGRDAVREKTSMYLGDPGEACAWTVVREVTDNVVDEALNGHGSSCEIIFDEDGSYWVLDDGRGMPVANTTVEDSVTGKKHTVSALYAITGLLHAGAKLSKTGSAYKVSRGSHGIGMKGTNFTSKFFEVWTKPKEGWHYIGYKDGKLVTPVEKCKAPDHPALNKKLTGGTLVHFRPDAKIVGADKFPLPYLTEWAMVAAYFTKDLTVKATLANGKSKTWHYPDGPKQYLIDQTTKLKIEHVEGKPFVFINELVSCAATFTMHDACEMSAFTNGLRNPGRGVHFESFFNALVAAIEPFKKKSHKFNPADLREGVVGLINVNLSAPAFGGQTKEKLVDERAAAPLRQMLQPALVEFFKKNKSTAEWICARAQALSELKNQFSAGKKLLNALKKTKKLGLPAKARTSPNCKPEERELFVIEGDSAGGTASRARDPRYQETLPLKGKVKNAWKAKSVDSVLLSQEVLNILSMIGYDPKNPDPYAKLRVGKIVLLSDPDPDGPLHPDTQVRISYPVDGKTVYTDVRIEDLASEEYSSLDYRVMTTTRTGQLTWVKPNGVSTKTLLAEVDHDYVITWSNKTKTVCSAEHRWPTTRKENLHCLKRNVNWHGGPPEDADDHQFIRAMNLKAGDLIYGAAIAGDKVRNQDLTVSKVQKRTVNELRTFYCLSVPKHHNFLLSNGVFSGNCHINVLELGLLWKILPGLFDRGMVYVAEAPEFYAKLGKGYLFSHSARDLRAKLESKGAPKSTEIHHVKGYGEVPASLLRLMVFDEATRSLSKIVVTDSKSGVEFSKLVSEDVATRKALMGI